jgi:hypothetical protein
VVVDIEGRDYFFAPAMAHPLKAGFVPVELRNWLAVPEPAACC